jgi:hypothetical protein
LIVQGLLLGLIYKKYTAKTPRGVNRQFLLVKQFAEYLLGKGFDVYGIDISPKQIEHAKQIISEDKLFAGLN